MFKIIIITLLLIAYLVSYDMLIHQLLYNLALLNLIYQLLFNDKIILLFI